MLPHKSLISMCLASVFKSASLLHRAGLRFAVPLRRVAILAARIRACKRRLLRLRPTGCPESLLRAGWRPAISRFASGRGFTLIELMVTLAVAAILLGMAAPSFNDVMLGNKLTSATNNLVASTRLARGEAINRNANITMCVSGNGTSCETGDWNKGWIVLSGTTVLQKQPAISGLKVTESANTDSLVFQPNGVDTTFAQFKVCRAVPSAGSQERQISLVGGIASVVKTTTGVCS